jgi:hypothetical protein
MKGDPTSPPLPLAMSDRLVKGDSLSSAQAFLPRSRNYGGQDGAASSEKKSQKTEREDKAIYAKWTSPSGALSRKGLLFTHLRLKL